MVKKYVLVSGGVISGIGKGIIASSTGLLLKTMGLKVTSIKIDPYLNIDAGTLSPLDHGTLHLPLFVAFVFAFSFTLCLEKKLLVVTSTDNKHKQTNRYNPYR
jgi:hypothetical protein